MPTPAVLTPDFLGQHPPLTRRSHSNVRTTPLVPTPRDTVVCWPWKELWRGTLNVAVHPCSMHTRHKKSDRRRREGQEQRLGPPLPRASCAPSPPPSGPEPLSGASPWPPAPRQCHSMPGELHIRCFAVVFAQGFLRLRLLRILLLAPPCRLSQLLCAQLFGREELVDQHLEV